METLLERLLYLIDLIVSIEFWKLYASFLSFSLCLNLHDPKILLSVKKKLHFGKINVVVRSK